MIDSIIDKYIITIDKQYTSESNDTRKTYFLIPDSHRFLLNMETSCKLEHDTNRLPIDLN